MHRGYGRHEGWRHRHNDGARRTVIIKKRPNGTTVIKKRIDG
jgi:hypothetical protein